MISISNLSLSFGDRILFDEASFLIRERDRIGLVGKNGAGKSTLLKVIAGQQSPDKGSINTPKDFTIGYLPQELQVNSKNNVFNETRNAFGELNTLEEDLMRIRHELEERTDHSSDSYMKLISSFNDKEEEFRLKGGYSVEGEIEKVLKGLGFEKSEFTKPVSSLSGGWQMRIELAKILLRKPPLILLDEPTNHLDIESITWLEGFLLNYEGALMMVSHDRAFLDYVTTRTIEVFNGDLEDYDVSFTQYEILRKERREQLDAARKNQQKEIARMERNIEKFRAKASKASFAQSLIKKLDKMGRIEVEDEDSSSIRLNFKGSRRSGKVVVRGENVGKSYGEKVVISNEEFEIERGQRVAFVGKNGMGKTTLSKIIAGELDHEGKVELGHNVDLGYYAQHQPDLLLKGNTVLKELEDEAGPEMRPFVRSILGAFLFSGEDVEKKVSVLSGGEKSRLALAKLLLRPVNFLVMDEPTNHLDMRSKRILKEALAKFPGTLVIVSHDRDFLDGLTEIVFEFSPEGIKKYPGTIKDFLEKRKLENFRELEKNSKKGAKKERKNDNKNHGDWFQKKKDIEKELRKVKNAVTDKEKEITSLEKIQKEKESLLNDPQKAFQFSDDQKFFDEYEQIKRKLLKVMEEWESFSLQLEEKEEELARWIETKPDN